VKRRRLLYWIAALAGSVGVAAWCMSSRSDPRFVGRWIIMDEVGNPSPNEIVFESNGTGVRQRWNGVAMLPIYKFHWWVDEDYCLLQQDPSTTGMSRFDELLDDFYRNFLRNRKRRVEWRLRTESSGENRMRVWQVDEENEPIGHAFEIVRVGS